jgi:hypothetical protein
MERSCIMIPWWRLKMRLEHSFVDEIPDQLEGGILYAALNHRTTIHLCCCGCKNEVVLPLNPVEWKLTFDGESVSMNPSVGNWHFPCRSHYWIRNGRIQWAAQWTDEQIENSMAREQRMLDNQLRQTTVTQAPATEGGSSSSSTTKPESFGSRIRAFWTRLFG